MLLLKLCCRPAVFSFFIFWKDYFIPVFRCCSELMICPAFSWWFLSFLGDSLDKKSNVGPMLKMISLFSYHLLTSAICIWKNCPCVLACVAHLACMHDEMISLPTSNRYSCESLCENLLETKREAKNINVLKVKLRNMILVDSACCLNWKSEFMLS